MTPPTRRTTRRHESEEERTGRLFRGGYAVVNKKFRGALDGCRVKLVKRGLRPFAELWVVELETSELKKAGGGPSNRCVHESELVAVV